MNRVICIKGHFYDGDKYETCPHCASGVEAIRQDPFSVRHSELEAEEKSGKENDGKVKREKAGFFHRGEKKETKLQQAARQTADSVRGTVLLQEPMETELPQQRSEQRPEPMPEQGFRPASEKKPGISVIGQGVIGQTAGGQSALGQGAIVQDAAGQNAMGPAARGQGAIGQGPNEREVPKSQESTSQSLRAAFAASARTDEKVDEGKTVGYFSTGRTDPPVGYLICTAGEDYGMGFPLKTGNNSIGRSASMDVVILDEKVSREKQAFVLYEPHNREFYMKPGEGTGLCYLNGELVLGPVKMQAFDMVSLGDTKLMLIPVCCERFSWEEI